MKKVIMILGILIGAVSCTSTNGNVYKTASGSVYRTVCASRYDCTEVQIEGTDFSKWYNGEMSDEEYSKKHPDLWMTDEEWDSL
jgi:lipoprotein